MKGLIFVGILFVCFIFSSATFTNPIFGSQDPWVTLVDGVYYYTESYCGSADICVKASKTLTGLGAAPWIGVWSASSGAPNSGDIWAPEMHYVNGSWYIYYGADNGDNNNHRIYVLQGNSPVGKFQEANTGQPHGLLKDSTNNWGIDPDVFFAVDGHLYLTWSCTNQGNANMPQRICLARMSDPVTISSQTTFLSTPTEYWETRDAPIQEGPVGYTHSGHTYITYSASASWIANDYSVGVLAYSGSGDILDAANWAKSGPILDHHGSVYGPGSVVFVPSIDGSEYWTLYHAIDRPDCSPAYSCRDIRMQKMYFDPIGYPILAYPVNPGVQLPPPAGEDGQPAGTTLIAEFGNAWGDAAEGNTGGGLVSGHWNYTDRFTATSPLGGAWDQIFSPWNPNPADVTAHVELQLVATGTTQGFPKFGFYCVYDDTNNHAEVFIDNNYKVLASHAVVGGVDQGWQNANLPAGFNANDWHSLDCIKNGNSFTFSLDGGAVSYSRSFNLNNGQTGLVVVDSHVNYRNLQLYVHY